ncbi:MAG: hypothetical protein N3D85_06550 [Candidatus Bathyarchaeota archaeon]|nr:hypothetical protein [Candidatus Bathyarchaeota archaeon]
MDSYISGKIETSIGKTFTSIALALLLLLSAFAFSPIASASDPPISIPTYAYFAVSPNPVGINQQVFLVMWLHMAPPTAAGNTGDRWRGFTVTVTKPDGTTQTLGPFDSDPTGSIFTLYTPNQLGQYTFLFRYPGQVLSLYHPTNGLPGSTSVYVGDTFLPSTASATLTVQQTPVNPVEEYPLPTNYWTRPISADNVRWSSIASNWLRGAQSGGYNLWATGEGPSSPHILWKRPIELGGVIGGSWAQAYGITGSYVPDAGFYSGGSYEGRFTNALAVAGMLFYNEPLGHSNVGGGYTALDLKTGKVIWHRADLNFYTGANPTAVANNSAAPSIAGPSFAQIYEYESPNQHGGVGGILWQTSTSGGVTTWQGFDAFTGKWVYNITGVPSGSEVYTNKGEIVRYVLNYNTTSKRGWLALWNNTAEQMGLHLGTGPTTNAWQWRPNGKSVNMTNAYSWNVSITADLTGNSAPTIVQVIPGDVILGRSSTISAGVGDKFTPDPWTMWAISDKPETRGQLLWKQSYPAPSGNLTRRFLTLPIDPVNRVILMSDVETMQFLGYSLDTGRLLWGPTNIPVRAYQYYGGGEGGGQRGSVAYGNLYVQGYGGEIFCINTTNGNLVWRYNNTNSGIDTPWGLRPIFLGAIADGKVYAFNNEHSPNTPLYRGNSIYCIDAFTGAEIFKMLSWAGQTGGQGLSTMLIADGVLVYYNYYDNSLYAIGKGPSATTVDAPATVIAKGESIVIRGTVTDQSAGAKAKVDNGEFSIVPAMSDQSQAAWMEYIYMQKPKPTNATGVKVKLTAVDPNGNLINIGTATSDINGKYGLVWTPEIEGVYQVIATFEGSNSYYGSTDSTYIAVGPAPSPQPTTAPTSSPMPTSVPTQAPTVSPSIAPLPEAQPTADAYIIVAAAVIVIVVVAVAAFLLKKRK